MAKGESGRPRRESTTRKPAARKIARRTKTAERELAIPIVKDAPSVPPAVSYTGSAADFIPPHPTLETLRDAAAGCRGCDLWAVGSQTVFGEGPARATVMFVGEQPGDIEDRMGEPFVGPSGKLLDDALAEAGIDRAKVYVTNAVKHFKWERGERGKRRIHKKPNDMEIRACRPWLEEEIALVRPRVIVALGATAAQTLLGKQFRVTRSRGEPIPFDGADAVIATVHPSAVLRAPPERRAAAEREFVEDIKKVARYVKGRDAG